MATKSFLKNVNISTKKQANNLVGALEKAEKTRGEDVIMSRSVSEVKHEEVKGFISRVKWVQ